MTKTRRITLGLMLAMWSVMVSSCHAANDSMGLDVVGYNHTDHSIGDFSVDGQGGSFLASHKQGGYACCISISSKYTPGMTVTVSWTVENDEHPQSRVVPVPPYTPEDGGAFAVHFLHYGDIKVFVTKHLPFPAKYPLKGDEAKM